MGVGIDIGSKSIKVVELSKDGDKFRLKGLGVVGYSGKSIDAMEEEREFAGVAEILMKLLKESSINEKNISISLPESAVFTRTIKFPNLTDQEINSAVKWEADQYIPIPLEEAIVQHEIVERNTASSPPSVSVLLVAAPRKLVQKYMKVVDLAKLNPVFVETELVSLVRSLSSPDRVSLIIDFGARSTDVAISKNGSIAFSRSIPTAGNAFTRAVAQSLGIEEGQAEQYKRAYGFADNQLEGKIKAALEPVFKSVIDEIKKAIHFYQTEEKGKNPSYVVVSGGTAGLPHVIAHLSSSLGLEVLMANPFAKLSVEEEKMKKIAPFAPLYAISVGLAMRQ